MSGRCVSCNAILSEDEMTAKWPDTNVYVDLCFECIYKSDDDFEPTVQTVVSIEELEDI